MYTKIKLWLRRPITLRMFTTKVLLCIFIVGLVIFSTVAHMFNPDGMIGNVIAELIGLCLAAIAIELLLVAREEQSKSDYERQQTSAVSLSLSQNDGNRSLIIFLNSFIVTKIKDPSLWLKFKVENGEQMSSVKLTQGEFSSLDLVLHPLATEKELNESISKSKQEPDELAIKWTDMHGVDRERTWSISHLKSVQKSLEGKQGILSTSL